MDLELEKLAKFKTFAKTVVGNSSPYEWSSRQRRDVIKGIIENDGILGLFDDESDYIKLYSAILLNDINFIDGVIIAKMTDNGVYKLDLGGKSYFTGWDIVDLMEVDQ